ncbi:MAG: sodium-translocating pyrophosphatase [Chloroflexota bacterium]|nr:sodium-translocating pyrophosphatase [Chloroflexota bacterium]
MDAELLWPVIIFSSGLLGIVFALLMARFVLSRDTGTPEMKAIADTIYEGAVAYLNRQYLTIGMIALVTSLVLAVLIGFVGLGVEQLSNFDAAWRTAVAFLAGALASGVAGYIGMLVAVRSNIRTAAAARRSLGEALLVALRGGAVSGFLIVALSLMGVAGIFYAYNGMNQPELAARLIVGFGFGASFVALFAQLGGGIYTKAADVGADLVGKVEAGIPEDDPRNAAVIADLVGDNVGDCAGRGADLFESTAAENIGAMILGAAIFAAAGAGSGNQAYVLFSLVVGAIGLVTSIIGLSSVRGVPDNGDPLAALNRGFALTAILNVVGLGLAVLLMLNGEWWLFAAGLVGIATSFMFLIMTQYYTATHYRPVRNIAEASRTGPATNIISGISIGFENTAAPALVISVALGAAYWAGRQSGLTDDGFINGVYGTAVATMGMLMSAAYVLAMDVFGPITDNAGGVVEMSNQPDEVRERTDALDAVGNTTKALTKGYAIGSAALAAFLLFSAYLEEADLRAVDLAKIEVFIGGFLGAMLVFLFSSLAIRAVGRAAGDMIEEVRRQFRSDPGIMAGTVRPDYARAVDISTRAALREMILPGALAVTMPVLVGLILRAEAVAALLIVGTMTGILLALVMNNAGGAWDNAKKLIESGEMVDDEGKTVAKGSLIHSAAVTGDTVGDPFKDTAGPSLHVLIKLLATITLVLAPLFIG